MVTSSTPAFPALPDSSHLGVTYVSLACALVVGALLIVRVRPGAPGSSLLIVPLLVALWQFGSLAIFPMLLVACTLAAALRVRQPLLVTQSAALIVPSFVLAALAAAAAQAVLEDVDVANLIAFAVAYITVQALLYRLAIARGWAATSESRADRPNALLSLLIAPLAGFPIVAGTSLGDGALLLALAALLALLVVVCEAVNLATARAEAEAERDRLMRAHELQDELVELIVHDVKNPLTAIILYTQLAEEELHRTPFREGRAELYLDRILGAGRAIERLINNLLHLQRFVASDELPPPEPVDVSAMARDVIAELEPLAEQKEQSVAVEVPDDTPRAHAPPLLLREALVNLVSNAVKYTPSGGHITLSAGPAETNAETTMVAITVTDTGVGLSPRDQERIFARFFRSEDPRVGREGGWGLGLALTHSIIERMGGRITVESALNKGASFRILLPVAGPPVQHDATSNALP